MSVCYLIWIFSTMEPFLCCPYNLEQFMCHKNVHLLSLGERFLPFGVGGWCLCQIAVGRLRKPQNTVWKLIFKLDVITLYTIMYYVLWNFVIDVLHWSFGKSMTHSAYQQPIFRQSQQFPFPASLNLWDRAAEDIQLCNRFRHREPTAEVQWSDRKMQDTFGYVP